MFMFCMLILVIAARQSSANHDRRCIPARFSLCIDTESMGNEELTLRCTESNLMFLDETVTKPVTWLKNNLHYIPDGTRVLAQNGHLVFNQLLVSDEGNWTCTNGSRETDRSPEYQLYAGKVNANPKVTILNHTIGASFDLSCNIEVGENTAQTDYSIQISRRVFFSNHTNRSDEVMTYLNNRDPDVVTWDMTETFYTFYSSNLSLHIQNFSVPDPQNVRRVKYMCLFSVVLESHSKTIVNNSTTKVLLGFSPPKIIRKMKNVTVIRQGNSQTLTVEVSSRPSPWRYWWKLDGVQITNQTSHFIVHPPTHLDNITTYRLTVNFSEEIRHGILHFKVKLANYSQQTQTLLISPPQLQQVTITNSCDNIAHRDGQLHFHLTLPADFPAKLLHKYRHSIPIHLELNWTTFSDAEEDSAAVGTKKIIDVSNLFENHWNGDRFIDLSVDRNLTIPSHVTNGVRTTNMRYRVQAKLIFNGTTAVKWSPECDSPLYQRCLSKSDAEINLKLSGSSKDLRCSDYPLIKVKETIKRHLYELFKCDNITVDPVKEYKCKENTITFKANLRAYHAMEKVDKFYLYLKQQGMTLFNDSVLVEQYFVDPPHLMYVYVAVATIGLILALAIFIIAVKICWRRSPKPKNVESQVKEEEERRGNSSTSNRNHRRDTSSSSPPPPPSLSLPPPTDSRSFTSDHATEESRSMTQYGGIPLANVDEVIDIEDHTSYDLSSSGIPLQSHDLPVFISRDSRSPSLVPSQQELDIRECPRSTGESSMLSDDVSLSRYYERSTESPATADSRSSRSSGYQSGQNVPPFCRHTHRCRHKTEGQPITAVGLMPVPLCTHILLQHCHSDDLTRTCSASQLPACHHIGASNLISVHPASPRLNKEGDDEDGTRETMFGRSRDLPLSGVSSSVHRPSTELRTVVPCEMSSPNPSHSDQSTDSGSPRQQHGLQGEQYNRQDPQTSSEVDSSIL